MILLIDNYDSFSYNLFQLAGSIRPDIKVVRNDKITVDGIRELAPSHLILSPGPGKPAQAGVCEDAVRALSDELPILGVCLGHQAICEAFGGVVSYASRLMHGKQSRVAVDTACPIFRGLPDVIPAARYHSLAVKGDSLPDCLEVTARARDDGEIMAVRLRDRPVYGLQFHPESILTPQGGQILKNFLEGTCHD